MRHLSICTGLTVYLFVAIIIGSLLGIWPAIALHLADLSPSQVVALRFLDLSPAQVVALRFPARFPEVSALGVSAAHNTATKTAPASPSAPVHLMDSQLAPALPPQIAASHFPEVSALGVLAAHNTATTTAPASPSPLVHLIDFEVAPTLPPIGHSRFCRRYPDDCKVHATDFRYRNIALTPERWNELNSVNRNVNRSIFAEATSSDGKIEAWAIAPRSGDCKDYAITKRHELLARGWPSRALLLSEVALPSGEHHLLLVVHTKSAYLVLDNLNDEVRPAAMTYNQYVWVRIQSPQNPTLWMRVL
jgi:predicted transglutaminase-like cysteine proteinase